MHRYKYIISIIILTASLLLAVNNTSTILYGDALGYYVYLPASVIHHKLDKVDELAVNVNVPSEIRSGISRFKKSYSTNESGNSIIQYTYGLSAMQSPGFLAVYLYDKIGGKSPSGFEIRYQNALIFLNVLYLLLGLLFCYKSLTVFFPKLESAITIIIGLLGTNLLWFGFIQSGMAHVPQFMLISLVLYLSLKIWRHWSDKTFLLIAFLIGLVTIIRPVDLIYGFVPLVFMIDGVLRNKEYKSTAFKNIVLKLIVAIILFIIPIIPQLLYWKMMTGSFVYDSYSNYHFHWTDPHIVEGLFGAKNGWFMYTPIMLIAAIGLFYKSVPKNIKFIACVLLPLHIYISYAWYNYNYINGFGSRPMIHIYPLTLFGIAGLMSLKNKNLKLISFILLIIASLISLNFTYKQSTGKLFSDESTWEFNKSTFLKNDLNYHDLFYLNSPWDQAEQSRNKACRLIDKISNNEIENTIVDYDSINQVTYNILDSKNKYPTGSLTHTISDQDIIEYSTLRSTVQMRFPDYVFMPHQHHKLIVEVTRSDEQIFWDCISINDKINKKNLSNSEIEIRRTYVDIWDSIDYYFPVENLQSGDMVKVYIWNPAGLSADFGGLSLSICK